VIHHAGVDADPSPEETALYHINMHGWPGIGYHGVILKDGSGYLTQRLMTMSYHVSQRNQECIGLLFNGDFRQGREPTEAQIVTAQRMISWIERIMSEAGLNPLPVVVGHKEIALPSSPTECPGSTFGSWIERLRKKHE
jgi:hypothetical protein